MNHWFLCDTVVWSWFVNIWTEIVLETNCAGFSFIALTMSGANVSAWGSLWPLLKKKKIKCNALSNKFSIIITDFILNNQEE